MERSWWGRLDVLDPTIILRFLYHINASLTIIQPFEIMHAETALINERVLCRPPMGALADARDGDH